jgi:menaquinone-dependent protoporphyrinogen oxidase
VAYGSTRGGTAGLAHMIADAFTSHHIRTEVRRADDVKDPSPYDAVVVGGGLYSSRWHPDAVAFVGRHRTQLRELPVWFFSSGPLDDSARSGALAPVPQVMALAKDVDIRGHMTFGGLMVQRHSRLAGLFAWGPEGDFRDRQHVSEWVERIAEDLRPVNEPPVRLLGESRRLAGVPPQRPTVVIVPAHEESADEALDHGPDQDEVDVDVETTTDWAHHGVTRTAPAGLSRIRRYLALDEEEIDDEGLDLLLESSEP